VSERVLIVYCSKSHSLAACSTSLAAYSTRILRLRCTRLILLGVMQAASTLTRRLLH
jgi:hypothetical protein